MIKRQPRNGGFWASICLTEAAVTPLRLLRLIIWRTARPGSSYMIIIGRRRSGISRLIGQPIHGAIWLRPTLMSREACTPEMPAPRIWRSSLSHRVWASRGAIFAIDPPGMPAAMAPRVRCRMHRASRSGRTGVPGYWSPMNQAGESASWNPVSS